MTNKDLKFYTESLAGEECLCGRTKQRKRSFCYPCWKELPQDIQRDLYARIGYGYEAAYERAVAYLQKYVWD